MPIYEFYCPSCHVVFSFFSLRMDTETVPACPRCHREHLVRQASVFSLGKKRPDGDEGDGGMPDIDESRLEKAMQGLMNDSGALDSDDPRQAARLMRRLFRDVGLEPGPGIDEAMRRMEAGEDPEKVEAELGDALDEDPFTAGLWKKASGRIRPPEHDETLYDLKG
ncbi:MAG: zinc ribbon domain-containing protein [Deltaproteobacteria bacterium]|nr:zinc ribbon domain-containing protein [Deltaproteobacteria bacterium]